MLAARSPGTASAWAAGVVSLRAPVEPTAGGVGRTGERGADHHRVGAARDRLGDVAGLADGAVGDDVDVATARLVHVVAARGGDVGDGTRHGYGDPEHR